MITYILPQYHIHTERYNKPCQGDTTMSPSAQKALYWIIIYSSNGVVPKKNELISSGVYRGFRVHHRTVSAKSQTMWFWM